MVAAAASASASASSSSALCSFHNQRVEDITGVTQEELFAFHKIDRQLFSRIVFDMKREPMESMYVVAFWLWLENDKKAQLVVKIISYPDSVLEAILEETFACLKVVKSDDLVSSHNLPIMQSIIAGRDEVNLRFFHENRNSIIQRVVHLIVQVCGRAFQDLIEMAVSSRPIPINNHQHEYLPMASTHGVTQGRSPHVFVSRGGAIGSLRPFTGPSSLPIYQQNFGHDTEILVNHPSVSVGNLRGGQHHHHLSGKKGSSSPSPPNSISMLKLSSMSDANHPIYALEIQGLVLQGHLVDQIPEHLHLDAIPGLQRVEDRPNNLQSERTIFLTFSKGYPISENELRGFINRTFGNIIEKLHMQEVSGNEQSLYARLVVCDGNAMEAVLTRQGKSKFSINGKHVWARKYVRRNRH